MFSFNLDAVKSNAQKRSQKDTLVRTIKGTGVGAGCGVVVFVLAAALTPLVVVSAVGASVAGACALGGAAVGTGTL